MHWVGPIWEAAAKPVILDRTFLFLSGINPLAYPICPSLEIQKGRPLWSDPFSVPFRARRLIRTQTLKSPLLIQPRTTALLDDYHSLNIAKYYEDMLKKAGWKSNGISELSPDEAPDSILVEEPTDKPVYRILLFDMRQIGLIFELRENPNNTNVRIVVGKPNWRE